MNKTLQLLYQPEIYEKITKSNILIIGVGGIGCELLKVLTNSGYKKMTILDLDTIEATNLNRQFYFRKEHVGMSKSLVGKESVLKKHPELDITAIHGSIFEDKYDVEFYQQFDLVFCALDNNLAREHLGRMCIRANRVMVDAGTGGFSGQSNVVKRFLHQCNNCHPSKGAPSFAVCTIRASPTQPIHCVVYAMALYNLLFGQLDESNVLAGLLDLAQVQKCQKDDQALLQELGINIFNKLFYEQIKQGLEGYVKPEEATAINQFRFPISYEEGIQKDDVYTTIDQKSIEEVDDILQPFKFYVQLFVDQFVKIMQTEGVGQFKFDKDDWDAVLFVTAVTNMRTYNFTKKFKPQIDARTTEGDKLKFMSIKAVRQLGGKIIPAIASTNAIAAAIQVSESKKVLEQNWNLLKMNWIQPSYEKISPTILSEPFETCQYCGLKNVYLHIYADFDTTKLAAIIEIAKLFGIDDYDLNGPNGLLYGKLNKQMKKLNDINKENFLCNFNKEDSIYSSLQMSILEKTSGRSFYWQNGFKYELIVIHKKGLAKPSISKETQLDDTFKQIKQLKLQRHEQLAQQRIDNLLKYGF